MHDVALIHGAQADASRDRCGDVRVGELQGGAGDLRLIDLQRGLILPHKGGLGIHLLSGHGVLLEQRLKALEVHARVFEQGVVFCELGLGLQLHHLERTGIQIRQRSAGLDGLALLKIHLLEFAVDPAADGHGVDRRDRAKSDNPHVEIRRARRLGGHRHRAAAGAGRTCPMGRRS